MMGVENIYSFSHRLKNFSQKVKLFVYDSLDEPNSRYNEMNFNKLFGNNLHLIEFFQHHLFVKEPEIFLN